MKKKLLIIIPIIIAVVAFVFVYRYYNKEDETTTLTVTEKRWVQDHADQTYDFEVVNDEQGRPKLNVYNVNLDNIEDIDISISHCKNYAVANVTVLIKK